MTLRYIIWDFDGTLFDTYPALIRAVEQALHDLNCSEPTATIAAYLNDTLADCIERLVARHNLDAADLKARLQVYREQITPDQRPPFPGAIEICRRFKAAGGQNFIFTHRDRPTLLSLLDYHGVTDLFAGIMTQDDGYPRKPDPAGFNALMAQYNLARDAVLTIGDRDLDIEAGINARFATCLYNAQPAPHLLPDYVIATFDELYPLLKLT